MICRIGRYTRTTLRSTSITDSDKDTGDRPFIPEFVIELLKASCRCFRSRRLDILPGSIALVK